MNNIELINNLKKGAIKFSWLIILLAFIFGFIFYYIAKQSVPVYTAKSSVFPLNATSATNTLGSISSIIANVNGGDDNGKNQTFTTEASVNIVDLASSRRTREAIALTKLPQYENKTIGELLVNEYNKHTGFLQNTPISITKDSTQLINLATNLLSENLSAKFNKSGTLELTFNNTNENLVGEVIYVFIDKLTEFYIEIKRKKAKIDLEFAVQKTDSLDREVKKIESQIIYLDEHTFFTSQDLKKFTIPKIDLQQQLTNLKTQYNFAVNNREVAIYKLQKETPIIEILDKPKAPFAETKKSKKTYLIIGVILGLIIGFIFASWSVIKKLIIGEINKKLIPNPQKMELDGI